MKIAIVLSFTLFVSRATASFQSIPDIRVDQDDELLRKWSNIDKRVKDTVESGVKWLLPHVVRMTSEIDLSDECVASLLKVLLGVRDLKIWAIKMLDATGKPPGGQLVGTVSALGDYRECLSVQVPGQGSPQQDFLFTGQYCMIDFRPPLPQKPPIVYAKELLPVFENLTGTSEVIRELAKSAWGIYTVGYRFGVCLPSTCALDDIKQLSEQAGGLLELYADVVSCETRHDEMRIDTVQMAIILTLLSIMGLVVVSTIIDLCVEYQKSKAKPCEEKAKAKTLAVSFAEALSIRSNWIKVFRIHETAEDDKLSCLNGIRFFSIIWVVLGHTYLFVDYQLLRNTYNIWDSFTSTLAFQIIGNGFLSVESFLFITSVLISYNLVKNYDERGPRIFNIPILIIHRIWRLLPSTMLVVGLTILLPLLGSGPMWDDVAGGMARNCRQHWWPLLVFGNNFVPFKDQCMPQTWYVAVDFQLFIVAVIYMFIFFKKPWAATAFNVIAALIGIVSAGLMTYFKMFPPGTLISVADKAAVDEITNNTYFLPQVHFGIYAIGLSLGSYLARHKDIQIPKSVQAIGWICAIACNVTILFIVLKWNQGVNATIIESVTYASLHRTGWGIGLAWLTLMCATGRGGYVNEFLSWKGYTVLNRLTYLVFLVHVTVYCYFIGSLQGMIDTSHMMAVYAFSGNLVISFLVALVLRVLFEGPALELEKMFFKYVLGVGAKDIEVRKVSAHLEDGWKYNDTMHEKMSSKL